MNPNNNGQNIIDNNQYIAINLLKPMTQITDSLYLGNIFDAQNIQKILKLGIKKVLSLITEKQLLIYPKEIEHKLICIPDLPKENIIQYFGECLLFIDDNKKILVHCAAGASRSATIVIAYIMWKNQLELIEAINYISQLRNINPNYGFIRQLKIFDKLLKKNKYNINSINFKEIKYPSFFENCCY